MEGQLENQQLDPSAFPTDAFEHDPEGSVLYLRDNWILDGADHIKIADAGDNFVATDVEAALAELADRVTALEEA